MAPGEQSKLHLHRRAMERLLLAPQQALAAAAGAPADMQLQACLVNILV
jgi:hypothetical protein